VEEDQFVAADRRLRRAVVVAAVVLVAAGVAGMWMLGSSLRGIEKLEGDRLQAAVDRAVRVTAIVAWVGGLSFVGCGLWLFRLGHRINRFDRYPPPGTRVIRDTRVRSGAAARTVANAMLLASLLSTAAGTFGMWYLYRLAVEALRGLAT